MGEWLYYNFAAGSFQTKKLCSRLYSIEVDFYSKNEKKSLFFEPPFGGLRVTRTPSIARVVDFLFVIFELFSLSPTVETLSAVICRSRRFSNGVGHFESKFQTEGASPTRWCQKTRVIAISCGIKISAVHCLVLSQSMRVTDRQTEFRLPVDRASIATRTVTNNVATSRPT